MSNDPSDQWLLLADEELTEKIIHDLLDPIQDDLWVAAACMDRVLDDPDVQRALLDLGIQRTESAALRTRTVLLPRQEGEEHRQSSIGSSSILSTHFSSHPDDAQMCQIRKVLLDRRDRLQTFDKVGEQLAPIFIEAGSEGRVEEGWEDDPWAGADDEVDSSFLITKSTSPPLPLSIFLTEDIATLCYYLVSQMHFLAFKAMKDRYWPEIFPFRMEILARIPLFVDASDYRDLLPALDIHTRKEVVYEGISQRTKPDVVDSDDVKQALLRTDFTLAELSVEEGRGLSAPSIHPNLLSAEELSAWYRDRVEAIIVTTGLVDVALSLVQHGVSQGVIGLDELGEDLSLISRLVYDTPAPEGGAIDSIGISEWRSLEPQGIVHRYLAHSKPETIVNDIRRLVIPYLFVLESRCERAGKPDRDLIKRHLYNYILHTDLNVAVPIFESSKPTLSTSQRLISDDEDIARLALACLYGSNSLNDWTNMSRIFECLPAWNFVKEDEEDEADTTVSSLSTFLTPATSQPQTSPSDLLVFFKPLPAHSLSRALDILDIHLESAEVLSRWGVPVPLRWLLQSAHDGKQQRAWAVKMARQMDAPTGDLDSEDVWLSLLADMLKLSRPDDVDTSSAFGALSADTIRQIFFGGLLSTGKFAIARRLIQPRYGERLLEVDIVEKLCLDCSREFYDNASSGNYNFGDMKLAYDCLSVAPQTPAVQKEREFIEATSRISSFNVTSRPGVPIMPIEVRLTKDKLSLVSRVLSSNESAYKHVEVLLELVHKLGFRNNPLAEVKTLAMVADTALQAEDFTRAFEASERMITAVLRLRQTASFGMDSPQVQEAVEVCWVACFQLGRQSEAEDVERKMALLGRALELCPPDRIVDILVSWRKLEAEEIERRRKITAERQSRSSAKQGGRGRGRTSTLSSRLQDTLYMPSPALPSATALASHTFNRVAAALPFGMQGRPNDERSHSRDGSPDVQAQARHALQRGIGWLIGTDEDNL